MPEWSPVLDAWRDAREEAAEAFACWRDAPGGAAYAAYRAAQDREDAAQDALSSSEPTRNAGPRAPPPAGLSVRPRPL